MGNFLPKYENIGVPRCPSTTGNVLPEYELLVARILEPHDNNSLAGWGGGAAAG